MAQKYYFYCSLARKMCLNDRICFNIPYNSTTYLLDYQLKRILLRFTFTRNRRQLNFNTFESNVFIKCTNKKVLLQSFSL